MLKIHEKYPLKDLNTFNIDVSANFYAAPKSLEQIHELFNWKDYPNLAKLVLGGGSNMLFTKDFKGLIIHPQIKGTTIETETTDYALVKVGAAENWDSFVEWAVSKKLGGIENLSLIPGNVGASPVQNIGAYGIEAKDCIVKLDTIDLQTGSRHSFTNKECGFAYRDSVFKNKHKGRYLITHVYFRLSKKPIFELGYGNIKNELEKFDRIDLQTVRQAIINIRAAKLPDPVKLPNAGSFFKNPIISKQKFDVLIKKFPQMVNYPLSNGQIKLAAGWLIDSAGLKGFVLGGAAVHENQALVLINSASANGADILKLARHVKSTVYEKFSVSLEFEVNIY